MQGILAVDMGNSRTQCGWFEAGELLWVERLPTAELPTHWSALLTRIPADVRLQVGWISVGKALDLADLPGWDRFIQAPEIHYLHSKMDFPIVNRYATPETLGTDRIVAVIGGLSLAGNGPLLVIDAGTAITYDFADRDGNYLGGSISPGIQMRFRALHQLTARLPLVEMIDPPPVTGDSTITSIQAGVLQGVLAEVKGRVDQYRQLYGPELQVVITGGDAHFFENHLKNLNFADANLNLRGIYHILTV
jgi:type III pantothenate kinase